MSNNKDFKVKNGILPTSYQEGLGTVTISGSTATLDLSTGSVFDLTPTSDVQVTLSNPAASGTVSQATLLLKAEESTGVGSTFSTTLYTGNGGTQTITNGIDLAGEGGLVWQKSRENADDHRLSDTERGVNKTLRTNSTGAEFDVSGSNSVSQFNSNGFVSGLSDPFFSGEDVASWTFRKAPKFFTMVTWSGNSTMGRTISHDLGADVGLILIKAVDNADAWYALHKDSNMLVLNQTSAEYSVATTADYFGDGTNIVRPTSTEFTIGSDAGINGNGYNYIAYLFAHDTDASSIIKCGSYTGNGQADGPEINLGFEPQWLLTKNTSSVDNWKLVDNMRGMVSGGTDAILAANTSTTEAYNSAQYINPTPTGFKIVATNVEYNANGSTYIYMAIRNSSIPTITYDPALEWPGGTAPTAPADGETDVITFNTSDGGTTYSAVQAIDGAK